jgi:hypothetical protein
MSRSPTTRLGNNAMQPTDERAAISCDFEESWKGVMQFFGELVLVNDHMHLFPILKFIFVFKTLEQWNGEFRLRAGQSMDALILSRSRYHGLRGRQAWLQITSQMNGTFDLRYFDGQHETSVLVDGLVENKIELTPWLAEFIERLLQQPIS